MYAAPFTVNGSMDICVLIDPNGKPFYWLTGKFENFEPEATDTDEYWLQRNYISIVPVKCDLSAKSLIKTLAQRFDAN